MLNDFYFIFSSLPSEKTGPCDTESKLTLEDLTNRLLTGSDNSSATLSSVSGHHNFSKKQLTTLAHTERLCLARRVDLSGNELSKMNGIYMLLGVEELNLDDNSITTLQGLAHLSHLRSLSVKNNSTFLLRLWNYFTKTNTKKKKKKNH